MRRKVKDSVKARPQWKLSFPCEEVLPDASSNADEDSGPTGLPSFQSLTDDELLRKVRAAAGVFLREMLQSLRRLVNVVAGNLGQLAEAACRREERRQQQAQFRNAMVVRKVMLSRIA